MYLILFTATATCAATAFIPPLWCACMSGLMEISCGAVCVWPVQPLFSHQVLKFIQRMKWVWLRK